MTAEREPNVHGDPADVFDQDHPIDDRGASQDGREALTVPVGPHTEAFSWALPVDSAHAPGERHAGDQATPLPGPTAQSAVEPSRSLPSGHQMAGTSGNVVGGEAPRGSLPVPATPAPLVPHAAAASPLYPNLAVPAAFPPDAAAPTYAGNSAGYGVDGPPLLHPVAKMPRQAPRLRLAKRPKFAGPRLADRIGVWRQLRSVVELAVVIAFLGALVAGVIAALVTAIVLALQNALG